MATGDSDDILRRVRRLLPRRWWQWGAPLRDTILGGLSDLAAWCFDWTTYARKQTRLATATGIWLDVLCYDFLQRHLTRGSASDEVFRALIDATIFTERVTRKGMSDSVVILTGSRPWIFEPWNTFDTGAYSSSAQAYGQMGYGVGQGGYGNMNLPGQLFMKVLRGANSGVPNADGYGGYTGGYGFGSVELVGNATRLMGVTDQQIEKLITFTKPTGVTVWLQIL
ncbi:hypothetical protein HAP48_0042360 [Bradyrhizobium septentrionale]|uniref:Uncharacterized protein n=1 Tax=Bradyrhizobium septentrionale TaxID=1404411 RepID=A0A973W3D3_9BRAD|nr:hypothetical protein [Bradyrhizobium septentrionale]UGY15102.1 hypothetical protein HAP48_0042360 [Bradyrhizobium septentrionale]